MGFPMSFHLVTGNLPADSTVVLTMPQGGAGLIVPAGYVFRPTWLLIESNTDLTAGTITASVADNGVAVGNGPTCVLSDTVQVNEDSARLTESAGIAAGHRVSVSVVAAGVAPAGVIALDAILCGEFTQA